MWPSKLYKPPSYASKARSSNLKPVEETGKEEPIQGLQELARSMVALDDDKKDELFDLLLKREQDF